MSARPISACMILRIVLLAGLAGFLLLAAGMMEAQRDPIVREATIVLPDWPADAPPMRVLFITDIHVAGPDMPPARLERIVAQANALRPDLILLGGDFVSDKRVATRHYSERETIAPLAELRARLGVLAVLGNHDHWRAQDTIARALGEAGIPVLANRAFRRGALTVIGVDDIHTGHDDIDRLSRAAAAMPGPSVVLSHSPDIVPALPQSMRLVFAGHTHCGQVSPPFMGRPVTMSRYGERYACGLIEEGGRTIVVSAGLGTSLLPVRFRAPPDMWLVTLQAGGG